MISSPLVSCIMPTFNRRPFVAKAVDYFLRQDYACKQLIVVDDGSDQIADLLRAGEHLVYIRLNKRTPLGEKRNLAVENSAGEIILHWDDDDWYSANRLSYQVSALLKDQADLCGLGAGVYYDLIQDQFWRCQDRLHNTLFYAEIIGGSLCYKKSLWKKLGKFHPSSMLAEDSLFLRKLPKESRILKLPNRGMLIYIRHFSNTWRFQCGQFVNPDEWIKVEAQNIIPVEDLDFYKKIRHRLMPI